jgi:signal transduction histidine kinase
LIKPTGDADMLLNMVGEDADRLNRIVGDLLDFVRPYELVKKPIAIEPVVVSAVDAASQALATSNVKVVTEFSAELPPFPADSHMLKQAMVNLVVNALQAMPRGGTVNVKVSMERRPDGAWLRIDVCDEGVGLSPRAAEKMFQPFFTTKATGTGLGLAVVKRIVDGHFGEVVATPNGGGKGTTFTVRLPPSSEREAGGMTPPSMRAAPRP